MNRDQIYCAAKGVASERAEARCMTDMVVVCSACHMDTWNPRFEALHPPMDCDQTWTLTSHEACELAGQINLPDGIKLFDIHVIPSGAIQFYVDYGHERSSIVIAPGDDPVGRFHKLLEAAMKERGIPADASKKIKKADEAKDKKMGVREGSKKDLAMDRALLKKEGYKKGK